MYEHIDVSDWSASWTDMHLTCVLHVHARAFSRAWYISLAVVTEGFIISFLSLMFYTNKILTFVIPLEWT